MNSEGRAKAGFPEPGGGTQTRFFRFGVVVLELSYLAVRMDLNPSYLAVRMD